MTSAANPGLVIHKLEDLPSNLTYDSLRPMAYPNQVLLCRPDYFDVIDVKNTFMEGKEGTVDRSLAVKQWEAVRDTMLRLGLGVHVLQAAQGLEDMVFAANPVFAGLDSNQFKVCIPARMRHLSRSREVPFYMEWFRTHAYRISMVGNESLYFEGGGDALWHPTKGLIWGGVGSRTSPEVYPDLARTFGFPVIQLKLQQKSFYHLDTAFTPVNDKVALVYRKAFDENGWKLLNHFFSDLIEVPEDEAIKGMACNAASFHGRFVLIHKGNKHTNAELRKRKLEVIELDTSEFLKSGGSVFCMKQTFF